MIDTSRQLAPAPKRVEKRIRRDEHAQNIKAVHARAADLMPADYLITHQQAEPERGFKIHALAKQRIAIRNAKRAMRRVARAANNSAAAIADLALIANGQ